MLNTHLSSRFVSLVEGTGQDLESSDTGLHRLNLRRVPHLELQSHLKQIIHTVIAGRHNMATWPRAQSS